MSIKGWFPKKARASADHRSDGLAPICRAILAAYDGGDSALRTTTQNVITVLWRNFVLEHGTPRDFATIGFEEQGAYIEGLIQSGKKALAAGDRVTYASTVLVAAYLSAVADRNQRLEDELAAHLDAIRRLGRERA